VKVSVFRSMGTDVEVHTRQQDGAQTARNMFASYEQRFSRFLANSELSEINSCGSSGQVSADMSEVLTAAAEIKKRTRGLVDIGVGRAVTDWGYTTAFADLVPPTSAPSSPGSTGWAFQGGRIDLDPEAAIDLGGIVKGWAADRVVESGVADVVSAGGDLRSVDPTLVVEVADEHGTVVADVHVGVGALATSSRCSRRWKVGSLDAHHIIDPRTARPAVTPIKSASVVAGTALEAEAGAKAVLLMGVDGLAWADRQSWIRRAVVIWNDGSVYANGARANGAGGEW
jgi:thiamine biosynthesis lipoprotein